MKKFLIVAICLAVAVSLVATPVLAAGKHGQAGKSNVGHLYLYEKYAHENWNWVILDGGAWGKMTYKLSGPTFDFVFNGCGLTPNTDYSLIYYADPWPGNNPGAFIASGTTNWGGNIHLAGSPDLGIDLPAPADANKYGAKIWLIPSAYYNSSTRKVTGWPAPYNRDPGVPDGQAAPSGWLFEHNLITFDDTDD